MAIEVVKPGLATTVQDAGREGYYNVGIPLSGALDQYSFLAANLLVGEEAERRDGPFLYRVHATPALAKVAALDRERHRQPA